MGANDRAAVYEGVSVGCQIAMGSPVNANRRLGSMNLKINPNVDVKTLKPDGFKNVTVATPTKKWTTGKISGIPTYNEIDYLLCGNVRFVAPTTPGGATLTRRRVYLPSSTDADYPTIYSLEQGSSKGVAHASDALFTDAGINWNRANGLTMDGSIVAKKFYNDQVRTLLVTGAPAGGGIAITVGGQTASAIAYNATAAAIQSALEALSTVGVGNVKVTGGPLGTAPVRIQFQGIFNKAGVPVIAVASSLTGGTNPAVTLSRINPVSSMLAQIPISPMDVNFYAALSAADLDTVQPLDRAFAGGWKQANRFQPIWAFKRSEDSWSDFEEDEPKGEGSFSVGADQVGMSFLRNLEYGDTVYLRREAIGPLIEPGFTYQLIEDMALKLTKISDLKKEGAVVSVDYSGDLAHESSWGGSMKITTQNTLSAL